VRLPIVLAAFAAAFIFAVAVAALTTVREVKSHASSLSQPVVRI